MYGKKTGSASAGPTGSQNPARSRPPVPRAYTRLWEPRLRRPPATSTEGLSRPGLPPRVRQGPPALVTRGTHPHTRESGVSVNPPGCNDRCWDKELPIRLAPAIQSAIAPYVPPLGKPRLHLTSSWRLPGVQCRPLVWNESELEIAQHWYSRYPL